MNQEVRDYINLMKKLFIIEYAQAIGCATKACKEYNNYHLVRRELQILVCLLDFRTAHNRFYGCLILLDNLFERAQFLARGLLYL